MAVEEIIVTCRKFRKLADIKSDGKKVWRRFSFWTKASDVEFNDGTMLEGKLGSISGDISNIKTNINTLTNHVNTLNNNVTLINNTITDKTGGFRIRVTTLAQYNALPSKDPNTLYFCT